MTKLEVNQIKKCMLEGNTFVPVIITEVGEEYSLCKVVEREWSSMRTRNGYLQDMHSEKMLDECQRYVKMNYKF